MKISLITIGKTEDKYLIEGIEKYCKRLKHYIQFKIIELPELKNTKSLSEEQQKVKEAEACLQTQGQVWKELQGHDQSQQKMHGLHA